MATTDVEPTASSPMFERRPWGTYAVLDDADDCKVKRITVDPGQRLSYQSHDRRAEHWVVVSGTATVTLDGAEISLDPGQSIDIPLRAAHRVANRGLDELVFIEVQLGDYFGEDDIARYSDDYGRAD
ncbi:MAG: phosphomannose isomerase type II C-terminal cupin domain [Acidimicrobiales bacterium]